MKIHNSSKIGLYIYDNTALYEKSDMVIFNNAIYIVLKDIDPENEKENGDPSVNTGAYSIYLGEKMTNAQDYLDALEKDISLEDKYVSVTMLQSILNHFMMGIDSKGVIGGNLMYSEDGFNIEDKNTGVPKLNSDSSKIIMDIFYKESINNAIFSVSRKLPELQAYIGGPRTLNCILKQYTYNSCDEEGNKVLTRVQELIDPEEGLIYYRGAGSTIDETGSITFNDPGEFKCSILNNKSILDRLNQILAIYSDRLQYMDTLETSLKQNFRYRSYNCVNDSDRSELVLSRVPSQNQYYIGDSDQISILITDESNSIVTSYNLSINLLEKTGDIYPYYYVNENIMVEITEEEPKKIKLKLIPVTKDNLPETILFSTLTYTEYYA